MPLSNYQAGSCDWRKQLKDNERKTKIVIITFFGIYVAVGLLVDVYVGTSMYRASSSKVLHALLTFQIFPYATAIMLVIAAVSLWVTFAMYDKIMLMGTEYHEVTHSSARTDEEIQFYNVVEEMKVAAGLSFMPKVYLIEADYMNAFASGYSEKSAMVAITRGLMQKLNRAELQAVMAHELSHIRHHDIKLNLTIAVLSNLMLIVIDMLFYGVLFGRGDRKRGGDARLVMVIVILRYTLPMITVLLTLFLSRTREYMADAGAVELTRDNAPLANALLKISGDHEANCESYRQAYGNTAHEGVRRASYIFDPCKFNAMNALSDGFSTHPGLDKRLRAIGFKRP